MDWHIEEWRSLREAGVSTEIILIARQMACDSEREGKAKTVFISVDNDAFERLERR